MRTDSIPITSSSSWSSSSYELWFLWQCLPRYRCYDVSIYLFPFPVYVTFDLSIYLLSLPLSSCHHIIPTGFIYQVRCNLCPSFVILLVDCNETVNKIYRLLGMSCRFAITQLLFINFSVFLCVSLLSMFTECVKLHCFLVYSRIQSLALSIPFYHWTLICIVHKTII